MTGPERHKNSKGPSSTRFIQNYLIVDWYMKCVIGGCGGGCVCGEYGKINENYSCTIGLISVGIHTYTSTKTKYLF